MGKSLRKESKIYLKKRIHKVNERKKRENRKKEERKKTEKYCIKRWNLFNAIHFAEHEVDVEEDQHVAQHQLVSILHHNIIGGFKWIQVQQSKILSVNHGVSSCRV